MDKEKLKEMHITVFDEVMKEKLVPMIGAEVANQVQKDRRDASPSTRGVRQGHDRLVCKDEEGLLPKSSAPHRSPRLDRSTSTPRLMKP